MTAALLAGFYGNQPVQATSADISLSVPNGGECLEGGSAYTIRWTTTGAVDHVSLAYTSNGSATVAYSADSSGYFSHPTASNQESSYQWTVPSQTISTGRITADAQAADDTSLALDSSDAVFSIDSSPPTAPVVSVESKSATQVKLIWLGKESTDTGCAPLTGYKVYRNGSATPLATLPATATGYTDTSVVADTSYTYKVEAYDALAATPSLMLTVATSTIAPSPTPSVSPSGADSLVALKILNLRARSIGSAGATILSETSKNAKASVDYGLTTTYGSTASSSVAKKSHSLAITGLTPSTVYHYRLQVVDADGNRLVSDDHTFQTLADGEVPQQATIEPKVTRLYLNEQPLTINQEGTVPLDVTEHSVFRIEGRGVPKTKITLRLNSEVKTFEVTVNDDGYWSATISLSELEDGEHQLSLLGPGQKLSDAKQILKFSAYPHTRSHDVVVLSSDMLQAQTRPRQALVLVSLALAVVAPGFVHFLRAHYRVAIG